MLNKDKVKAIIEPMPETFSVDDLVERIVIIQKIERGLKDSEKGEGEDWEDVKNELESW